MIGDRLFVEINDKLQIFIALSKGTYVKDVTDIMEIEEKEINLIPEKIKAFASKEAVNYIEDMTRKKIIESLKTDIKGYMNLNKLCGYIRTR